MKINELVVIAKPDPEKDYVNYAGYTINRDRFTGRIGLITGIEYEKEKPFLITVLFDDGITFTFEADEVREVVNGC